MKKSISGFTIVELLIVIVVIAILAAVSIVAYNGIQDRARSTSMASAGAAYVKAYALYRVDNSTYPGNTCLGSIEDYPADPPFLEGECYIETYADGSRRYSYTSFDSSVASKLAPYTKGIQMPKLETTIEYYGGTADKYFVRGMWLIQNTNRDVIAYALPGDRQCAESGGSAASYASKNYNEYSDVTYCYLTLKNTD